jgi:hypothetical protein
MLLAMAFSCWIQNLTSKDGKFSSPQLRHIDMETSGIPYSQAKSAECFQIIKSFILL